MRPITLILLIHDHQPVGNFDGVFEQAYADAYDPFLRFLESHPRIRTGLHTSGPLLQWIALHRNAYLGRLRALVDRDQVELWGGGFFEPILSSIPEADRRGQIIAMADWLELELGRRPRGLWLTERVWEPGLASSLNAAGVRYTAVDDAHFFAAGFERDQLWGHFLTEDQGLGINVFPIHRELRYLIPFEAPERTVEMLRRVAQGGEGRIAMLGDDGEKFGVWPGTRKLCYEEQWLERWARALEAEPWIELRTPAEAIAAHPPLGLAYLPTASYHEMQEWALPPAAQERYHRAAERLEPEYGSGAHDLLRGGHWRNFQARYPESNRIHKRMLRASRLLWRHPAEDDAEWKEARTRLWRSQCNCPYWHGVFGGLYLPHLRSAVYHELIAAETQVANASPRGEAQDVDMDGFEDVLLETRTLAAWISSRGGRLWGLDDRRAGVNYLDTMSRRPEFYHRQLRDAVTGGGEGLTIHAPVRLKEPGLAALAESYDTSERDSFLDRWEEQGAEHDWAAERFALESGNESVVTLHAAEGRAPELEKRYALVGGGLEVHYTLRSARPRTGSLRIELNLGLHVREADDRTVEIDGERATPSHFGASASQDEVSRAAFVDRWADRRLEIRIDRPSHLDRSPIDTVSLSEGGAERVFQGVELVWRLPVALEPGSPWQARLRLAAGRAEGERGA